jgi:hypothetical protein
LGAFAMVVLVALYLVNRSGGAAAAARGAAR